MSLVHRAPDSAHHAEGPAPRSDGSVSWPGPGVGPWVGLAARLVVGGVWVVASLLKLPDPQQSVRAVRAYEVLPEAVVPTLGALLPGIELVVGLLLLLGLATRPAAVVSAVLLVVFVAAIGQAWARGLTIDCGCFGGGGQVADPGSSYFWEIVRDAGLLLASVWLVARPRTRLSLHPVLFGGSRGHRG
ncbi:MauE/DoxX family redox-associated membrane protein [Nocardioides bruguierae]|uniref:MauE/DoxX family redox-associated membrane protein n=1 Tax=Nocardioides bruguierae TaxID=2945102 RepID=UPI00202099B6|nr:MauE/DoxX family redox-associated membrane protein [Nocardioides bruguierae]MCL8025565.1 DoxX family membrane protein [Nocardioides bruguierae]